MIAVSQISSMLLGQSDPLSHVLDGRLFFDDLWGLLPDGWTLSRIGITKQVFMCFLAGFLTLLFFWSYSRQAGKRAVPTRWGNFVEFLLTFIRNQMTRPFMGHHGDRYVPVIASFFVYILFCNLLGLVPFFDWLGHGGNTATANLGITGGFAICSFTTYHFLGMRAQGNPWTYLKNLFPHVPFFVLPVIVVVELAAHVVRPCALAIRLFANMLAGHILVAAILGFTAAFTKDFLVPGGAISILSVAGITALTFLELLVALIQAFVFSFLTTVFLSGAVHPQH